MSLKVRCPGCGEKFQATGASGEKIRCKHCGQAMRLPGKAGAGAGAEAHEAEAAGAGPASDELSASGPVRFRCPDCGTKHATPRRLAGQKVRCQGCGKGVRVPGEAEEGAGSRAGSNSGIDRPSPRRSTVASPAPVEAPLPGLKAVEKAPTELDIYGLQDTPAASPAGGPARDEFGPSGGGGGSGDDGPLPPRAGYGELTEAQKKKIAKRAAKADRLKPSFAGAGMGVSLGAVVGIALFGWRMMRWMNRASRAAAMVGALSGAGDVDEPVDVDPKVAAAETDKEVETELKKATIEAREWLDPKKHPDHGVFEMGNELGRKMVEGFYERGAVAVYVLDPTKLGSYTVTAQFAVKLPNDPAQRLKIFAWEGECLGLEPDELTADHGQHYLTVATD